jgi:hypothetical protein
MVSLLTALAVTYVDLGTLATGRFVGVVDGYWVAYGTGIDQPVGGTWNATTEAAVAEPPL